MDNIRLVERAVAIMDAAGREVLAHMKYVTDHRMVQADQARREVRRLERRFSAWRRERPELYVSQCPYMQRLLRDIRAAYSYAMLFVKFPYDEEVLQDIENLLKERPPKDSEPDNARAPAPRGSLYFCLHKK